MATMDLEVGDPAYALVLDIVIRGILDKLAETDPATRERVAALVKQRLDRVPVEENADVRLLEKIRRATGRLLDTPVT